MICWLDIQHRGKPSRPSELGAGVDLDGDGLVEVHEREASLTPVYAAAAFQRLVELGVTPLLETEGEYAERHARVVDAARSYAGDGEIAYVACHLNAGGGDYGLAVHDHRSALGRGLARCVADELAVEFDELDRAVVGTSAPGSFPRAHPCLAGIYAGPANIAGVVFEPCFLDQPRHRELLTTDGLRRIGVALADGVAAWLLRRRP